MSVIDLLSSSSRTTQRVAAALALLTLKGSCAVLMTLLLAETSHFTGQYQNRQVAVSRAVIAVLLASKSRPMIALICSANALDTEPNTMGKEGVDLVGQATAAQYQPSKSNEDRGLMFRIALGLGLAYMGFVACWIWATRRRSRPPRH